MSDEMSTDLPDFSDGLSPHALDALPDRDIVYPTIPPAHVDLIATVRSALLSRTANGTSFPCTAGFQTPINCNWRIIYKKYAAATNHVVTDIDAPSPVYSPSTAPANWSDQLIYRFLRARKLNAEKAADMFQNYLHYRYTFGVDDLFRQSPLPHDDVIRSIIGHALHGVDKHGRPIYIQRTGHINAADFVARVPEDLMMLTHTCFMEEMMAACRRASRKTGRLVEQTANIIDTTGVTLGHAAIVKFFRLSSFMDQNYYPETLGAFYMINAPSFLPALYALARPFLDPVVQSKIHLLSASAYQKVLADELGRNGLPKEFGGLSDTSVPFITMMNSTAANDAAVVALEAEAATEMQPITVAARSVHDITHDVTPASSSGRSATIWWAFQLDDKDIDFTVELVPINGEHKKATVVVPPTRIAHSPTVHRGLHTLTVADEETSVSVRIRFDNTFSYLTRKLIKVRSGIKVDQQDTAQTRDEGQEQT